MDAYIQYIILFAGLVLIIISGIWFAADLRRSKKLIKKTEDEKKELQSIISDAEQLVQELNNFSNYLLDRIDQKNNEAVNYLEKLDTSILKAREINSGGLPADAAAPDAPPETYPVGAVNAPPETNPIGSVNAPPETYPVGAVKAPPETYPVGAVKAPPETFFGETAGRGPESDRFSAYAYGSHTAGEGENDADPGAGLTRADNMPSGRHYLRGQIRRYTDSRNKRRELAGKINAIITQNKKNREVLRCYGEGMDETEIAKRLDIGRGEVALILGLYKTRSALS